MTVRVVSLVWGTAWERYGRNFANSFAEHWPADVELLIITDKPIDLRRGRQTHLQDIGGYLRFFNKWSTDREAMGHRPPPGTKTNENGYSWRHDALKWMPQAMATIPGLDGLADGDIFVWFDADTETTGRVPDHWIESLLGDADVACLQRNNYHTEIGFYAMRVGPMTRSVLRLFADLYINDAIFKLKEWHSAFAWDVAVASEPDLKIRNLNTTGRKGHVWPMTLLGAYTEHHKGKRKDA